LNIPVVQTMGEAAEMAVKFAAEKN